MAMDSGGGLAEDGIREQVRDLLHMRDEGVSRS